MKDPLIICDIDGVICDSSVRLEKYADTAALERGDYEAFRASMALYNSSTEGDVVITPGISLLHQLYYIYEFPHIVFLTMRGEIGRGPTLSWLQENIDFIEVDDSNLIMRPELHWHPGMVKFNAVEHKRQETKLLSETYDVVMALDDRPDICAMYAEMGINVLTVTWAGVDCCTAVGDKRVGSK